MDLQHVIRVLSPKQLRSVIECESARISLWSGAVSSGKTIASLLALLISVAKAPDNGLIFIVGRTLQTIERNLIEVLQQPAGPFGPLARYVQHTRGSTVAVIFGRTVHLIGANDVRAEGRIRGATASLIYIDEATLIPEAFFTMCLSRLRVPGARLLGTTNPDGPGHWLRRNFLLRGKDLDLRSWHFVLDDNPWLTADYVTALKKEYVGLFYRRFVLGEWCLAEGAVYDMWEPDHHVVTELPEIVDRLAIGCDYGTTNPFAGIALGLGRDGRLYLTHEWRYDSKHSRRQLTDVEYSARLTEWMDADDGPGRPRYLAVDPSAASFVAQCHRDGLNPYPANNAVSDGIRMVSSLLASDQLRVHASCAGWIEEIGSYSWDPAAAERGFDAPVKAADHSLDAGRYAIVTTEGLWRGALALAA
ncbi:PBSX family phage terminase large subunit [Actinomadura rudentiformis]|uniref:PBSX family phage terminase large subunit n=1 Tax=Actinomadura rudentiformis TaxID=359158 RepID=A0A6H9YFQ4_9ACTN|nr:PBSX family phage terminase large subunit [Actinomadura rudentiformis]